MRGRLERFLRWSKTDHPLLFYDFFTGILYISLLLIILSIVLRILSILEHLVYRTWVLRLFFITILCG
nr:MAG TPA: NUAM protein [Caudoviricetes sp.]